MPDDIEAPWLDPDWPARLEKPLCECSICHEPLNAGDSVVFTDAGIVCADCIMEMDWRKFLSLAGLQIEPLTAEDVPNPYEP